MYLKGRKPDVITTTELAISIFENFCCPSFHQQHELNGMDYVN